MNEHEKPDADDDDLKILDKVSAFMGRKRTKTGDALVGAVVHSVRAGAKPAVFEQIGNIAHEGHVANSDDDDDSPVSQRATQAAQKIIDDKIDERMKQFSSRSKRWRRAIKVAAIRRKDFNPAEARDPSGQWMGSGTPASAPQPPATHQQPEVSEQPAAPKTPQEAAQHHAEGGYSAVADAAGEFAGAYTALADQAMHPDADIDVVIDKAKEHAETAKSKMTDAINQHAQDFLDHVHEHYGQELEGHEEELKAMVDAFVSEFADKIDEHVDLPGDIAINRERGDHDAAADAREQIDNMEDNFQAMAEDFEAGLQNRFKEIIGDHEVNANETVGDSGKDKGKEKKQKPTKEEKEAKARRAGIANEFRYRAKSQMKGWKEQGKDKNLKQRTKAAKPDLDAIRAKVKDAGADAILEREAEREKDKSLKEEMNKVFDELMEVDKKIDAAREDPDALSSAEKLDEHNKDKDKSVALTKKLNDVLKQQSDAHKAVADSADKIRESCWKQLRPEQNGSVDISVTDNPPATPQQKYCVVTDSALVSESQKGIEWVKGMLGNDHKIELPIKVVQIDPSHEQRAHWNHQKAAVALSKGDKADTVVHEIGHAIESTNQEVRDLVHGFLVKRVGNQQVTSLAEKFGNFYGEMEFGRDDDFAKAFGHNTNAYYVGKVYGSGDTEVLSMGIQKLYEDPLAFSMDDPEYFDLVVGILTGKLLTPRVPDASEGLPEEKPQPGFLFEGKKP